MPNDSRILAEDCSPIEGAAIDSKDGQRLQAFSLLEKACFKARLGGIAASDDSPIVRFDYDTRQWWSGRYIGDASFPYGKRECALTIGPRFGDAILVELLGEAYHFRLAENQYRTSNPASGLTLKNLMAIIWLAKLERASRYGLPRKNVAERRSSRFLHGRIDIQDTIRRHPALDCVVTESRNKEADRVIAEIVRRAQREIGLHVVGKGALVSDSAQETLNALNAVPAMERSIGDQDYASIRYHPIYAGFKELVDFSWQILKGSWAQRQSEDGRRTLGYFLDMAELWELYLRNKLASSLAHEGYSLMRSSFETYPGRFFQRLVIPDIVFERDGDYLVFDAKYKNMRGRTIDLDREDFFQIHSYMSFMNGKGRVNAAGLIYPCTGGTLFDSGPSWESRGTNFIIGGPRVEKGHAIDWAGFEKSLLAKVRSN